MVCVFHLNFFERSFNSSPSKAPPGRSQLISMWSHFFGLPNRQSQIKPSLENISVINFYVFLPVIRRRESMQNFVNFLDFYFIFGIFWVPLKFNLATWLAYLNPFVPKFWSKKWRLYKNSKKNFFSKINLLAAIEISLNKRQH